MTALSARFWAKVNKDGPAPAHRPELGSCWLWTAGKDVGGYGIFRVSTASQKKAHRVSYVMLVGAIPDGLQLDHLCRVRHCVRPDHLEPVTGAENCRRGTVGDRFKKIQLAKTHCPAGHPYADENLYSRPSRKGRSRECRECTRIAGKNYYARHPERREIINARRRERSLLAKSESLPCDHTERRSE